MGFFPLYHQNWEGIVMLIDPTILSVPMEMRTLMGKTWIKIHSFYDFQITKFGIHWAENGDNWHFCHSRGAGVPCVIIRGYAKGVGYQPGQKMNVDLFGASWNAVLINKYWRLIDVHWGARFITGENRIQQDSSFDCCLGFSS